MFISFLLDIYSFFISEFSNSFTRLMNKECMPFKSQNMLEYSSLIDSEFIYNIASGSDNKVTDIVWMTLYMGDNFEKFGNNLSFGMIRSSIHNR